MIIFPEFIKKNIFWYIWKLKLNDCNHQYSNKFNDETNYNIIDQNDIEYQIVGKYKNGKKYNINYRDIYMYYSLTLLSDINIDRSMFIVSHKYYWYSSGLYHPYGYKQITEEQRNDN